MNTTSGACLFMDMQTVRSGYPDLVRTVKEEGRKVAPRGHECREVSAMLVVKNPLDFAMPVACGRRLNQSVGAVEALQLLGGVSTPVLMTEVTQNFAQFMDGQAFYGAYGPRIRAQLPEVQRQLEVDPDTRQALLAVWRVDDLWVETRDLPCTVSLHFFLRDGALELHTHMRSQDAWRGWAYDAFQFTRLQCALADALGAGLGAYYHRADSFHLYAADYDAADGLAYSDLPTGVWHRPQIVLGRGPIERHMAAARAVLEGHGVEADVDGWFLEALARYR